ncbi:MAG: hypothetical protein KatS3mg076_2013 [Candidatus Binatia bacterium]|nr:MAG: hypothetical protein KatS3mg076_2013 [Candidatus Binatia bacterium]
MASRATPEDFAHFRAIAQAEAESEADRIGRAARSDPGQRLLEGFRLGRLSLWTPAVLAEMDARADGQVELARRRVALGLPAETE